MCSHVYTRHLRDVWLLEQAAQGPQQLTPNQHQSHLLDHMLESIVLK
jgi:hypothetical protein